MTGGNSGLPPGYTWRTVPQELRPKAGSGQTSKGIRTPGGTILVGYGDSRLKAGTAAARQAWDDYAKQGGK